MRSFLSLVLGTASFILVYMAVELLLKALNAINLWTPLIFCLFLLGCYFIFYVSSFGTILASRGKKWVSISLFVFQTLFSIFLVWLVLASTGFALFYLIPYGSIGFFAVGSIFKTASNGVSYDSELKALQEEALYSKWPTSEFLQYKDLLYKKYSTSSMIGFLILVTSILISSFVIYALF